MNLPSNLTRFEPDIRKKLEEFKDKLTFDDVVSWILQFDPEHHALATKIFLQLRYYGSDEIQAYCKTLYSRLPKDLKSNSSRIRKAAFIGFGGPADSSAMILYHYRIANSIPESQFASLENVRELIQHAAADGERFEYLYFIDDFIGTGGQAANILSDEVDQIRHLVTVPSIEFHALFGFADGIERVQREVGIKVQVVVTLTDKDKVFHEASGIVAKDYFALQRVRDIIRTYGERLYPVGPLGYGGSQARISFFYNTPNNTLPIVWARSERWIPLLPRTESKPDHEATREEKAIIVLLTTLGNGDLTSELELLERHLMVSLLKCCQALSNRNVVRMKDNEEALLLELTGKGHRESAEIFDNDFGLASSIVEMVGKSFAQMLEADISTPSKSLEKLIGLKEKLLNLVTTACRVGDARTVLRLQRTTSWLLWKGHAIKERIRLGQLILGSFDKAALSSQYGYTKIDDIGWSEIVEGHYENASRSLEEGIDCLLKEKEYFGVCQGWRHLQAIKARNNRLVGAELGLRLVHGASCAIVNQDERMHQQARIFRGLANLARSLEWEDRCQWYQRRLGDFPAAHVESLGKRNIRLSPNVVTDNGSAPEKNGFTFFLLRHPVSMKNSKRMFGRHLLNELTEEGRGQVDEMWRKLTPLICPFEKRDIAFYSGTYPVTLLMAKELSSRLGVNVIADNLLDSINSGDLTGCSEEDVRQHFPEVYEDLMRYRAKELDGYELSIPNGESVRDLTMRLAAFLLQRVFSHDDPRVCILAGHNSSITALLNILTSADRAAGDSTYKYFDVPLGSITEVKYLQRSGEITYRVVS